MTFISSEIDGVVRHLLTVGAGYLVGAGIVPVDSVPGIVTAAIALLTVVWSVISKKKVA